jgi:hypothetical protein
MGGIWIPRRQNTTECADGTDFGYTELATEDTEKHRGESPWDGEDWVAGFGMRAKNDGYGDY